MGPLGTLQGAKLTNSLREGGREREREGQEGRREGGREGGKREREREREGGREREIEGEEERGREWVRREGRRIWVYRSSFIFNWHPLSFLAAILKMMAGLDVVST